MKTKKIILVIAFLAMIGNVQAQDFFRTYGGNQIETGLTVLQMPDNGYVTGGTSNSGGTNDAYLIRTNANGIIMWTMRYGSGSRIEQFRKICLSANGDILATGATGPNAAVGDILVMRINPANGAVIWQTSFDSGIPSSQDIGSEISEFPNGDILIAGGVYGTFTATATYFLRLTSTGTMISFYRLGDNTGTQASVVALNNGNYIIGAGTNQNSNGLTDMTLMEITAAGGLVWAKNYGGTGNYNDVCNKILIANDGNYIVAGSSWNFNGPSNNTICSDYIVKTDRSGNELWSRNYWLPNRMLRLLDIVEDPDGSLTFATYDFSSAANQDIFLTHTDNNGNQIWTRRFTGTGVDQSGFLIRTNDGGYALVGSSTSFGSGTQLVLIKTDAQGNVPNLCNETTFPLNQNTPTTITINYTPTVTVTTLTPITATLSATAPFNTSTAQCPQPVSGFTVSDNEICEDNCVTYTDNSDNVPTSWTWTFIGGTPSNASGQGPHQVCYANPGTYNVTLTTSNAFGNSTLTQTNFITVQPKPDAIITPDGPTTFCIGGNVTLISNYLTGNLWSTGETTQSITTDTSGTFMLIVTGAGGCSDTDFVTVIVNPLPTPIITPSGPTTFCDGGNVTLTSNYLNGNSWSTGDFTQNTIITAGGSYYLIVTDGNGCTDTTQINITVNPLPTPIITVLGPSVFCMGDSTTLSSNYATGNLWSTTETNQNITVFTSGNYLLTVTDTNGCSDTTSVPIVVQNCCFAANNALFTQITTNTTISANTVWADKYYIAAGVIVTVDNATLDITNVDIVFGECAGIDFVNGANLRATNSVFRPCDETKSWRGLSFTNSTGIVNECTFKNAFIAADLRVQEPVRFTNNLFLNNHEGIYIRGIYDESITGNTFTIDNTSVEYKDGTCSITGGIDYGITGNNVTYGDVISQNDFIYSASSTSGNKRFIGIYNMLGNNGKISSNHFSNMYRSMEFSGVSTFAVDNNSMEITSANFNNTIQIRVGSLGNQQTTNIDVRNNTISCTPVASNNILHSGILIQLANNSNITANSITGFESAIVVLNASNSNITENIITDSKLYGIYAVYSTGNKLDIACNEIRMDLNSSVAQVTGIGYFQTTVGNKLISIRNNCILETTHAISLQATFGGTLPRIVGNYFYNYTRYGVLSQNFVGSIGTGLTQATAGKNSFVSNNIPAGAIDIASTSATITSYGNFGISSISNVTTLGNNLFNSIAHCGNQIGTISSQIGNAEICTDVANNFRIANVGPNRVATLSADYESLLLNNNENYFISVIGALNILSINNNATEQNRLYSTVLSQNKLNANETALFYHYYLISIKRYNDALTNLPSLSGIDQYAGQFIEVERIKLGLLINNSSATIISGNDLISLETIAADSDSYVSRAATDLLQAAATHYYYNYEKQMQINDVVLARELINAGENRLGVFPNPATNIVTINYAIEIPDACELRITDITGRIVLVKKPDYNNNTETIDISSLSNGVYLFTLYEKNTPVAKSKVIKQ